MDSLGTHAQFFQACGKGGNYWFEGLKAREGEDLLGFG